MDGDCCVKLSLLRGYVRCMADASLLHLAFAFGYVQAWQTRVCYTLLSPSGMCKCGRRCFVGVQYAGVRFWVGDCFVWKFTTGELGWVHVDFHVAAW